MSRRIILAAIAIIACQLKVDRVRAEGVAPAEFPAMESTTESPSEPVTPTAPKIASAIDIAKSWQGTPYRYAGKDRRGIDCSHFVHAVYSQIFPTFQYRMAQEYLADKSFSEISAPRAGDLIVFPSTSKYGPHVGIVTDGTTRTFIGSQSSTGVKETSYAPTTYWGKRPYRIIAFRGATDAILQPTGRAKKSKTSFTIASNRKRTSRTPSIFSDLGRGIDN
jgi:cell wall-associated NlpC family hydrolase